MEEELQVTLTSESGNSTDNTEYLEAIKTLKENSVDRSKYDALKADNKRLLDAIVNGQEYQVDAPIKQESIEELREKVFHNPNQTNLEYVTNALKLRSAILEESGEDIFVGASSHNTPTANDYATAERVAQGLQEMIDASDGDPNVFLNEYQRRVKETAVDKLLNQQDKAKQSR